MQAIGDKFSQLGDAFGQADTWLETHGPDATSVSLSLGVVQGNVYQLGDNQFAYSLSFGLSVPGLSANAYFYEGKNQSGNTAQNLIQGGTASFAYHGSWGMGPLSIR